MKKRDIAVLCTIFSVVILLGGIFLHVFLRYGQQGLSLIEEMEEKWEYNGKYLLSEDGQRAIYFRSVGKGGFEEMPKKTVDLTPFGFSGVEFSYFLLQIKDQYGVIHTNFYPQAEGYEPFWPACTEGNFVYIHSDGKKYRVHPKEGLCYPMFSDSIEGVDPYGTDVLGFSGNASYALSLSGTTVTVYHTDPYDHSLRIVDTKTVDLSRYGIEIRFGAFVSDKEAYFVSKAANGEQFFALNCETGEVALSPLDPEGVYGETLCEMYAQRLDSPEEGKDFRLSWVNLLLGKKFESCKLEGVSEGEIFSVSPSGNYVVASLRGETDEKISVLSKKKEFSLSSVLQEGEVLKRVDFVYENVIFLTVEQGERTVSRCYKICF